MLASSRSAMPISSARADGDDDVGGVFRIGAERHHVGGDPAHRAHEGVMQRQINQRRGNAGDQQRDQQQVDRIAQQRLAQRRLVHDDLDVVAAHRRGADDAHHVFARVEHQHERVGDRIEGHDVAHVEVMVDRRRHVADRKQAALLAHLHGDRAGADRIEDLLGQAVRHHAVRRRFEHERGGIGAGQAVFEPVHAEIGDRRDIDQHFPEHHEQDREDEELAGKSKARRTDRLRPRGGFIAHRLSLAALSKPIYVQAISYDAATA